MKKLIIAFTLAAMTTTVHGAVSFTKSPRYTPSPVKKTTPVYQRSQRPVVIVTKPSPSKKSGLGVGHVLGAAALAGAAGYYIANNSNNSAAPQAQTHSQPQHSGSAQQMYAPSTPGNKIITCLTVNGTHCNYNNGMALTKISPSQYASINGYSTLVSQTVTFQNGHQFFVLEVK